MEWQPIETAPKDGRDVLLCRLDDDGSYWMETATWWVRAWAVVGAIREPYVIEFEPTHWMPLPPPPVDSRS